MVAQGLSGETGPSEQLSPIHDAQTMQILEAIGAEHIDIFYGGDPDAEVPGISHAVEIGLVQRVSCDEWYRYELSNAGRRLLGLPPKLLLSEAVGNLLARIWTKKS